VPTKFRAATLAASAVLTMLAPAAANGDTGAITNITPLGGSNYQATYTVAVTTCSSSGYCGGYGYAWQVGPSDVCDPDNYLGSLTWVGNIMSADVPGTDTGTDTFVADSVPFKLCLGTSHASMGRQTVAETVYAPAAAPAPAPAPAVTATPVPTPVPTAPATPATPVASPDAQKCTYWSGQETKRGKTYNAAKKAYKKKRTSARRRAMTIALEKLRTAERKALSACG
jgi:hypothetical protein